MDLHAIAPIGFLVAAGATLGVGVFRLVSGESRGWDAAQYLVAAAVLAVGAMGLRAPGTTGLAITTAAAVAGSFIGVVSVRRRRRWRISGARDAPELRE